MPDSAYSSGAVPARLKFPKGNDHHAVISWMRSWNSVGFFNVKMIKGDSGSQHKSQMGCCPYHCCYAVLDWPITAQGERIYTAFEVYRKFKHEMLVVGSLLNIVGCWLLDSFVYSQQHRYTHITYTVVMYSSYSHIMFVCYTSDPTAHGNRYSRAGSCRTPTNTTARMWPEIC